MPQIPPSGRARPASPPVETADLLRHWLEGWCGFESLIETLLDRAEGRA